MYEQASHALLNEILAGLKPEIGKHRLRHFYTRLGANFYAIYSRFKLLYGNRPDFKEQMVRRWKPWRCATWKEPRCCASPTWRVKSATTGF